METPDKNQTPKKEFSERIRQMLATYKKEYSQSLEDIARDTGYSPSTISKYLSGKPEGDVAKLESLITDVVANAAVRESYKYSLFTHAISDQIKVTFETIRKTGDVGLVTGPAGLGKTCGCQLYCVNNPTTIFITIARKLRADPKDICRSIIAAGGQTGGTGSNYTRVVEKLQASSRLIIVDNAHLLAKSGLGWLFDLHDETGSPIALVGNPEILDRISKNDQQFSRIGYHRVVNLTPNAAKKPTENIVHIYFPDHVAKLLPLALQVSTKQGHFRALKKQLILTREIINGAPGTDPVEAFQSAHGQLVRNYDLQD